MKIQGLYLDARVGLRFLAMISAAFMMVSCQPEGSAQPIMAKVLVANDYCARSSAGIERISDSTMLDHALGVTDRSVSSVDFSKGCVLLVAMGEKPSAGYRLELTSPVVERRAGIAVLRINEQGPPPDSMAAQVVTSPCLVIGMPWTDYESVQVENTKGEILGTIALGKRP